MSLCCCCFTTTIMAAAIFISIASEVKFLFQVIREQELRHSHIICIASWVGMMADRAVEKVEMMVVVSAVVDVFVAAAAVVVVVVVVTAVALLH